MLDDLAIADQNPLLLVAIAVGGAVLLWFLWGELRHRARRFGGDDRVALVMFGSVVALLVSFTPGLVPVEVGFMVFGLCLGALYRPDVLVRAFGGPNLRWRALRAGRELQVLMAEQHAGGTADDAGAGAGGGAEAEFAERLAALADLESPATSEYIGLVRAVVAAPDGPDRAAAEARLAEADAALRASLGARPAWERALQRRMLATGAEAPAWTAD